MNVHIKASPGWRESHPQLHSFIREFYSSSHRSKQKMMVCPTLGTAMAKSPAISFAVIVNLSSRATSEVRSRGTCCSNSRSFDSAPARPAKSPQRAQKRRSLGGPEKKRVGNSVRSLPLRMTAFRLLKGLSLRNPDLDVGPLIYMHGLDKPDLAFVELHH